MTNIVLQHPYLTGLMVLACIGGLVWWLTRYLHRLGTEPGDYLGRTPPVVRFPTITEARPTPTHEGQGFARLYLAARDLGASQEDAEGLARAARRIAEDLATVRNVDQASAEDLVEKALLAPIKPAGLQPRHPWPEPSQPQTSAEVAVERCIVDGATIGTGYSCSGAGPECTGCSRYLAGPRREAATNSVREVVRPSTSAEVAAHAGRVAAAVAPRIAEKVATRAVRLGRSPLPSSGRGRGSWRVADVAALTGWPTRTVYSWAQAGRIPCERIGRRRVVFHAGEVKAWWTQFRREREPAPARANGPTQGDLPLVEKVG